MDIDDLIDEEVRKADLESRQKWRKNPKWLAIKGVSKEDLANGSSYIEKLKFPPWQTPDSKPQKQVVGFGKHANLTIEELKDEHPSYFDWAVENVKGFKEKAKQYL